jgi:ribonuclease J
MNFKIHRGTHEIGGSCVEIWADTTRIVLDFGLPLVNPDKTPFDARALEKATQQELIAQGVLPDIPGLFEPGGNSALILSHAHADHYGLMNHLHPDCPVYLGQATQKIIEISAIFQSKTWAVTKPHHFESGKSFLIGDIEITPYLMDHSAFDAYAFMIKSGGRSLFYSGDFRLHGRKAGVFDWFSRNVKPCVDYLLLEGTSVGHGDKSHRSEGEVETEFVTCFKETQGINLVYTSGQNIDRLVSIYRACLQTGKTLAIDFYAANLLKDLASFGAKIPYPSPDYPEIRVFFPYRLSRMITQKGQTDLLYRFKTFKITKDEISAKAAEIVMLVRPSMQIDLDKIPNLAGGSFIYSMWTGYKADEKTRTFIENLKEKGLTSRDIHTSGHADHEALQRMITVLKPKKLVPIHTFGADQYQAQFTDVEVLCLQDRQVVNMEVEIPRRLAALPSD